MIYYFHYSQTHHIADSIRLSYYLSKSRQKVDVDALDYHTTIRILEMYKIIYTIDSYETVMGPARYVWINAADLKKISKLLFNFEWDASSP